MGSYLPTKLEYSFESCIYEKKLEKKQRKKPVAHLGCEEQFSQMPSFVMEHWLTNLDADNWDYEEDKITRDITEINLIFRRNNEEQPVLEDNIQKFKRLLE